MVSRDCIHFQVERRRQSLHPLVQSFVTTFGNDGRHLFGKETIQRNCKNKIVW